MTFGNPLGLWALLAVPIIIGIHMFQRRFPRLEVAGTHLWDVNDQDVAPGRRRDRLPLTRNLLLELLVATMIALVLAQPNVSGVGRVEHLVAVLDDSASMSAILPDGRSVREHAIEELEQKIAQLGRQTVVTLLKSGRRTESLTGTAVAWTEAQERLKNWIPRSGEHDLAPAWDIAAQLAGDSGYLLCLTNRMPEDLSTLPSHLEVRALGTPLDNASIELARWLPDPRTDSNILHVRIRNHGRTVCSGRLVGQLDQQVIFDRSFQIPSTESRALEIPLESVSSEVRLQLKVDGDPMALDNERLIIPPRSRRIGIAVQLNPSSPALAPLERGLAIMPAIDRVAADEADLIIADLESGRPKSDRELWWMGIGGTGEAKETESEPEALVAPFLMDRRAPLLDGVVLGGVIWGGAGAVEDPLVPLVSSQRLTLLGRLSGTRTHAYLLNIDFARSNLASSPDWPVLLSNLFELCRADQPGLRRWNFRLHESIRFRMLDDGSSRNKLRLVHDSKEQPLFQGTDGFVETGPLEHPGRYEIYRDKTLVDRFSVGFHDSVQSDLTRMNSGDRPAKETVVESFRIDSSLTWLVWLMLSLVMIVLLINWFDLRRSKAPRWNR